MKYSGAVLDNPMEVSTSTIVRILGRCETGGGRIQNFSEAVILLRMKGMRLD